MHSSSPILHEIPFILPLPLSPTLPPSIYLPPLPLALRLNPYILSSPCSTPIQSLQPAAPSFPPFVFFLGWFESLLVSIHLSLIAWDVCIPFREAIHDKPHSFQSLLTYILFSFLPVSLIICIPCSHYQNLFLVWQLLWTCSSTLQLQSEFMVVQLFLLAAAACRVTMATTFGSHREAGADFTGIWVP